MAGRKIFMDDQKSDRRDMTEDQKQRWSSSKSREGRLSYWTASAAVDDKYQRFEENQQPNPRAQRWFSRLSVSHPCRSISSKLQEPAYHKWIIHVARCPAATRP